MIDGNIGEECSKKELDMSIRLPIQTGIETSQWVTIESPKDRLNNSSITFKISGDSVHYLDLSDIQLYLQVKLVNSDDTPATITSGVSTVNNILHSAFKNIEVKIGDHLFETHNDLYPFKAYFENLLAFNKESKDTIIFGEGWGDDKNPSNFNVNKRNEITIGNKPTIPAVLANPILVERLKKFTESPDKTVEFVGNLHLNISTMDKLLMDMNDVKIELTHNDTAFYLLGLKNVAKEFKFKFIKASIQIRKLVVSPSVMLANSNLFNKQPIPLNYKNVVIKTIPASLNSTESSFIINTGLLPVRLIVGFLKTAAIKGDLELNPFNFENFKLKSIKLTLGDNLAIPYSDKLTVDFTNKRYLSAYKSLFSNIKYAPNNISYDDYANGSFVVAYNLSPDLCTDEHLSLFKKGDLKLDIVLEEGLQFAYSAICYLEFNETKFLNKSSVLK